MINRRSFIQLPSIKELEETLEKEAKRSIPIEKKDIHYVSLEPFKIFLDFIGIETGEISLNKTWQEARKISEGIINDSIKIIFSMDKQRLIYNATSLYRYLSEEDKMQKADLIFTFGAKTTSRLEKAIELYKKGLAPKLLFSGGTPLYSNDNPEADNYKQVAVKKGVKEKDIYVENQSITIADNARSSLNFLDKINFDYKKIILVNSPYSQRRGFGVMMKYTSPGTVILRVNSTTREGLRENDWFTNEEGIRYVLSEYYKIWFGLVINTT